VHLTVQLADALAEGWYDHDMDLGPMALLTKHQLRSGARVFDLGAHQGVVACAMAKLVEPGGNVVAVEAQPHNARVAEINRELNGAQNLVVIHAAAAAQPGSLFFGGSLNGQVDDGAGDWGRYKVRAVTIDELAAEHGQPDLIVIDVEGFEIEALRGAEKTLLSSPDFFVEVHVGIGLEKFGGSPAGVASFFPDENYELAMCTDDDPEPLPFDEHHEMTRGRFFLSALSRRPRLCPTEGRMATPRERSD
jgi:FkbM family methyltransferase